MNKVAGGLIFVIIVALFSCSKDSPNNPNIVVHDSTLIAEFIRIDTTRVPGQDTLSKYLFKYDSRDRISKVLALGYGLTPTPYNIFELEYIYTGNDTLPKIYINKYWSDINQDTTAPPDYADSLYLFYSGNRIVRDSLYYHTGNNIAVVTTFTEVNPNLYSVHIKEVFRWGAFYSDRGTYNVHVIKQGDNVVEMRDTVPFFNGPLARRLNLGFDNKINPFRKIALRFPFYRNYQFDGYVPDFIPYFLTDRNANNILSVSMTYFSNPPTVYNFAFDYLNHGLPSQVRTIGIHSYNEIYRY